MSMSARAAHASSCFRFSSESSRPVGFWKFGTRYRQRTVRPAARSRASDPVEVVEVDAVRLLLDADQRRAGVLERADRAGVGRQFDQDDVARVEQHLAHQVDALLRSGRDQHLLRRGRDARATPGSPGTLRPAACGRASARTAAPTRPSRSAARPRSRGTPPRRRPRGPGSPGANEIMSGTRTAITPILRMADPWDFSAAFERK